MTVQSDKMLVPDEFVPVDFLLMYPILILLNIDHAFHNGTGEGRGDVGAAKLT